MKRDFLQQLMIAHEKGLFADFVRESARSGLLFEVLPQLRGLDQVPQDPRWHPEGDVWTHTLLVIENLPLNASFALALSALLHDVGKATTTFISENGWISAHGHEGVSGQIAHLILDSLGADERLSKEVIFLVRNHMVAHSKDANAKTLRRLIREGGRELVDQLLQHGIADVAGGCRDFTDCKRLRSLFNQLDDVAEKPQAVLTGNEIIELTDLEPGPEVGAILQSLADLGTIDRERAVEFVRNFRKTIHSV